MEGTYRGMSVSGFNQVHIYIYIYTVQVPIYIIIIMYYISHGCDVIIGA